MNEQAMTQQQRVKRGRCLARLYLAAQHLSQVASDDACRLIEEVNDPLQQWGFNTEMDKTPYATRAGKWPIQNQMGFKVGRSSKSGIGGQLLFYRMTTPPWMQDGEGPLKIVDDTSMPSEEELRLIESGKRGVTA